MHLFSLTYVLHALPVSVFLIWSPEWCLLRTTWHKALCFVVFSITRTDLIFKRKLWGNIFRCVGCYGLKDQGLFRATLWSPCIILGGE
jgi:hypothetical protein